MEDFWTIRIYFPSSLNSKTDEILDLSTFNMSKQCSFDCKTCVCNFQGPEVQYLKLNCYILLSISQKYYSICSFLCSKLGVCFLLVLSWWVQIRMQHESRAFISLTAITNMVFDILFIGRVSFNVNSNEWEYFHILNESAHRVK